MKTKEQNQTKMIRSLRDILLDASEEELREALTDIAEDFASLAARGRAVAQRALTDTADTEDTNDVRDLHRGLGVLVQMLRRRYKLPVDELAEKAKVDANELLRIENDPTVDPNPRTIYQLERYFKLQPRSLMILSGAIRVNSDVRAEAIRFAACSNNISGLSREERRILNGFVRFLQEHTDQ